MKKVIVLIVCLCSSLSFSQMTMKKLDGTSINNGDVFTYTSLADPDNPSTTDPAYLGLKIFNSSASNINVKMKLISMTNANGSSLQFCIDPICVGTITVGNSYPSSGSSIIPANGQNGSFDHFANGYAGNGLSNVEYVLKFYMVNSFGAEIGTPITFTYRYSPNLSTPGFNAVKEAGINIKSTLVSSQVEFDATTNGRVELFDLSGRLISQNNYTSGYNTVDVSNLNAAVYLVNFATEEGKKATLKVVKK
jgi:hypothetical protein